MKPGSWMTLIPIVLVSVLAAEAEEPTAFQFSRPVMVPENSQDELFSVPLDSNIYAATRDGFPDFRVYDAGYRLVPFVIRQVTEHQTRTVKKFRTAHEPKLRPLENDAMEISLSLQPEEQSPQGLRFFTPLRNFEQRVRVYTVDGGKEVPLVDGATIFDYSQFMDVRKTEVPLPENNAREFRIVVDQRAADSESPLMELSRSVKDDQEVERLETTLIQRRPFRIDQIEFWTEQTEQTARASIIRPWTVQDVRISHDADLQETHLEFSNRREPLTQATIVTSSRNFSRRAELQVGTDSSTGRQWRTIGEATLSRFQLRDFHEEHLMISAPETRHTAYRVVIHNGDSPELEIESVQVAGHLHQVVFLRQPDQTVQLAYGAPTADALQQDTVALTMALGRDLLPVAATLGDPVKSTAVVQQPVIVKNLLTDPVFLGAVVVVLVVVFGWGLYQAGRRIEQMPGGDAK